MSSGSSTASRPSPRSTTSPFRSAAAISASIRPIGSRASRAIAERAERGLGKRPRGFTGQRDAGPGEFRRDRPGGDAAEHGGAEDIAWIMRADDDAACDNEQRDDDIGRQAARPEQIEGDGE